MQFKTFIEMESLPFSSADDVVGIAPSMDIIEAINDRLETEFLEPIESPETGLASVISVLGQYSINMPVPDDLDAEDDEFTVELANDLHLYVVYVKENNGLYDFYAEVTNTSGLEEILEDEEEETED